MSLVINTNVAALNGQRNLAATQAQQSQTFQRLSTGLRVNSAKDDAGGLYLAQAQTKDIRGLGMATRNAGDGISLAQTAEGALDQIGKNLQRINELAIQSANGTYDAAARGGLQKEVDELTQEINRIVETTEFNGQKLLNSSAVETALQISFKNESSSQIRTGLEGGLSSVNGVERVTIFGSDKTFAATGSGAAIAIGAELGSVVGLSGGANLSDDQALTTKSSITADLAKGLVQLRDDNGGTATGAISGATFTENGVTFSVGDTGASVKVTLQDGSTFTVSGANLADSLTGATITGAASFGSEVLSGRLVEFSGLEKGAVSFNANALQNVLAGGLNTEKAVDISTQLGAQQAITQTRNAIDMVSELRATFGAAQNRFEAVISGNQTYSENLSAARSRIQDADFAAETANLAKQQVLQQAGISALGQANASAQAVLGLL